MIAAVTGVENAAAAVLADVAQIESPWTIEVADAGARARRREREKAAPAAAGRPVRADHAPVCEPDVNRVDVRDVQGRACDRRRPG